MSIFYCTHNSIAVKSNEGGLLVECRDVVGGRSKIRCRHQDLTKKRATLDSGKPLSEEFTQININEKKEFYDN